MRRNLLLMLAVVLAGGCFVGPRDWHRIDDDRYQYCDESGCYQCDSNGCTPDGNAPRPSDGCVCPAGFVCDAGGSCVQTPCAADRDCEEGCYCDGRLCVETRRCRRDEDCASLNLTCDEARFTCEPASRPPADPPPPTGGRCTTDAGCPAGQTCCDGLCKPARTPDPTLACSYDGECGGGDCRDGWCHAACTAGTQCGTGDVCREGFCVTNPSPTIACVFNVQCGANRTCINGTCHANCTSDAGCANAADFCDDGICQPDWRIVSECSLDRDCKGVGEQCVNGQCRTRCMQDAGCAACPDGPRCVMGYCQQ